MIKMSKVINISMLKWARKKKLKMTQSELADFLGYKRTNTISRWETGKTEPRDKDLEKLADACERDVNIFYKYNRKEAQENLRQKIYRWIDDTHGEDLLEEHTLAALLKAGDFIGAKEDIDTDQELTNEPVEITVSVEQRLKMLKRAKDNAETSKRHDNPTSEPND